MTTDQKYPTRMAQERAALLENIRAMPDDELRENLEAFALESHRLRVMQAAVAERLDEGWGLVELEPIGDRGVSIVVCAPGFDEEALMRGLREEVRKAFGADMEPEIRLVAVAPALGTKPSNDG